MRNVQRISVTRFPVKTIIGHLSLSEESVNCVPHALISFSSGHKESLG